MDVVGFFFTLIVMLIGAAVAGFIYIIPSLVAFHRKHPNRWLILAINVAFGATIIGWIGPLVWALNVAHQSNEPGGSHGGESGLNIFINDIKRVALEPASRPREGASSPLAAATGEPTDSIGELERLTIMFAAGHLTQAEYTRLKALVL